MVSSIHHGWRRYIYLVDLQQKNERLQRENQDLKQNLREAQRRVTGLKRYERLLAFRAAKGFETLGARVIRPAIVTFRSGLAAAHRSRCWCGDKRSASGDR